MPKTNDSKMSLTHVLCVAAVIFIFQIVVGVALYGLLMVFVTTWSRYKKFRPILVGVVLLPSLWLSLQIWDSPESIRSMLEMAYLNSLDSLTGFLREHLPLSGLACFKIARFLLRLLPLSPLFALGLFVWRYFRLKDKHTDKLPTPLVSKMPGRVKLEKLRHSNAGAFIGINPQKQPVHLSDHERGMHTQVIGSTGFGKTTSVLMPLLLNDMRCGKAVVFIDGKGDKESLNSFMSIVREAGREHDAYIFAPAFANISNPWNPLASGNPVVQKDRIVGAQIWSDEYYKKKGEDMLQTVLHIFDDLRVTASFPRLAQFLRNPDADFIKGKKFRDPKIEGDYQTMKITLKNEAKNYAGIISDINLFSESFLKPLFKEESKDEIKLYDIVRNQKIVYFSLPVLMMEETMKRIARMVIHDLKIVCSDIQNYTDKTSRPPISVFIDEFASFATENFVEFLNKARSAGMGITIIHQSMGDIEAVDKNFARQVFENTNIKIVLRIDDPATIEQYARMAGTRQEMKYTYQTDRDFFGQSPSGGASMREVDVFKIDPNTFRSLGIGEAVVMVKSSRKIQTVKLDYIELPEEDLTEYTDEARNIVMNRSAVNEVQPAIPVKEPPQEAKENPKEVKKKRRVKLDNREAEKPNAAA